MKINFKKLTILSMSALMLGGATYVGYNFVNANNEQHVVDDGVTIGNKTNIKAQYLTDTSYQLTAIVEPSDTLHKDVTWSIYWKNDSSTFAKGKDPFDYISIAQTSSDKLTIVLECLQEFGETIVVKVTSDYDESLYATCDIDYGRKVKEVKAFLNGVSTSGQVIDNNTKIELTGEITYNDVYTYNTLYEYTYEFVDLSDRTVDNISERGTYKLSVVNSYFRNLLNSGAQYSYSSFISYLDQNVTSYGSISKSHLYYGDIEFLPFEEVTQARFIEILSSTSFTFRVTVGDVSGAISCKFNFSPSISSLSLSESSILF